MADLDPDHGFEQFYRFALSGIQGTSKIRITPCIPPCSDIAIKAKLKAKASVDSGTWKSVASNFTEEAHTQKIL